MLDLLLRYVTLRNLVIAGLMAASAPFAVQFGSAVRKAYLQTAYPPVRDLSGSGSDIQKLLNQREEEKLQSQYRRVTGLIEDARALGYNVGPLTWRVSQAMALDVPGKRQDALTQLAEIELIIPRKKVQYIPLYAPAPHDMMSDDDAPAAKAAPTKTPAKTAAKKKKKSKRKVKPS